LVGIREPNLKFSIAMVDLRTPPALATPAYLIHVRPGSAVYHRNLFVFASQVIPYAVCAALWLPSRNASAPKIAFGLSTALFVAACLLYVPVFVHPEIVGGDMSLGYILVCLVTTAAVVAISFVAFQFRDAPDKPKHDDLGMFKVVHVR